MLKYLFIAIGIISLGLGFLGIFIPMLPTTPFLLLSAALFARSSKRLYNWLLNHKILGEYICSFLLEKAIPLRIKVYAISLLWLTMLWTIFFAIHNSIWLQVLMFGIGIGVTIHILSYKTKK